MTIKSTKTSKTKGRDSSFASDDDLFAFANVGPVVNATPIGEPYHPESTTRATSQYSTSTFSSEVERPKPPARVPVAYSTGAPPRPPPTTYIVSTRNSVQPAHSTGAPPGSPPTTYIVSTGNNVQSGPSRRNNDQDCCNNPTCCWITWIVIAAVTICCLLPLISLWAAIVSASQIAYTDDELMIDGNTMDEIPIVEDLGN